MFLFLMFLVFINKNDTGIIKTNIHSMICYKDFLCVFACVRACVCVLLCVYAHVCV